MVWWGHSNATVEAASKKASNFDGEDDVMFWIKRGYKTPCFAHKNGDSILYRWFLGFGPIICAPKGVSCSAKGAKKNKFFFALSF